MNTLILAAVAEKPAMFGIMLKALWIGLRWPLALFLGYLLLRASFAPIVKAIGRAMGSRK